MKQNPLTFDVFGLGTLVVDYQMFVEHYPSANSKSIAESQHVQVGGPVVTALATLSALGSRGYFVGRWNHESFGQLIENDLNSSGLEFRPRRNTDQSITGVAQVWIDRSNGDRTIVVTRGTEIQESDVDTEVLARSRALHLDGWPAAASLMAAQCAHENGRLVFLDAGSVKPGYDRLLPLVDVLLCPEATAARFWDQPDGVEAGRRFLSLGPKIVAITRGSNGVVVHSDKPSIDTAAFKINAVDTNGAGDVFAGAFIHQTLTRIDDPSQLGNVDWQQVSRFAAAVAAMKCEQPGNRSLPTVEQAHAFLESRG
jgi:sugar/nucleoside kinase (ribokinase family)